jgi:tetratricopeptide (TPR) repeat protein
MSSGPADSPAGAANEVEPRQLLATALAQHEAGLLELAEAGYRAVLERDPDELDALNLLAVMLQERGELDQAAALLARALTIDPDFPEALSNLARVRRVAGAPAEAAGLARRAIALDPELAEAHLNLGRALLDLGNDGGAAVALRQAADLAPESDEILVQLGSVQMRLDNPAEAADSLTAALALNPDRTDAMIGLGLALVELDRLDEALALHEKAVSRATENPAAHAALATTLRKRQDTAGSIAACRRTLDLAPDHIEVRLMLAVGLTEMGQFAAAAACCHEVLALQPDSVAARRELTRIGRRTGDLAEVEQLRSVLDDRAAPRQIRIAAGMAAANLLEQSGDYDSAFAAFDRANRLIRAHWIELGQPFDGPGLVRYVDWATTTFTADGFAATADWGDPSELPVFIVGMPRSGTSLVEQIAASHPGVFGAGELKDIGEIVRSLNGGDRHLPIAEWDRDAVRHAAAAQVSRLRGLGGGAGRAPVLRVIDKIPDNCRLLGQIAILFPRARIIVCRRDLRDVCLSCYFQHFADGQAWTTDLAEMAERARQIDRLLAHWLAVLPIPVLEVQYEDVVANLEAESRRLIAFLGLEWDPACLAFHETERPVLTASVWQVRQPLYSSSMGRWQHYRAHLGPLLEGLKGLVPEDC